MRRCAPERRPWLVQPLARGGMIAIDELAGRHDLFAFRLELQQLKHTARAAADEKLFIADAEFAGPEVCQGIIRPGGDEFQVLVAELCIRSGPGLKAAQTV